MAKAYEIGSTRMTLEALEALMDTGASIELSKELREKVRWCQEEHMRKKEFERKGIFCKKEDPEDYQPSTSQRVKQERGVKGEVSRVKSEKNYEYYDYVEKDIDGYVVID